MHPMYNRSIGIASLTETTRKRTPAMKHTLQLFAYRLLTLWHHGLIRLYQKFISPGLGRNCRFSPSCSQYGIEAIRTHGCVKGLLLTAWRIARCNPLGRWGYDPVPEKGRWKNPARHLSASALFSTRHEK